MKQKLLSFIISVVTIGLPFGIALAESYDLKQYFPLSQGDTHVFTETKEEVQNTTLQIVWGVEVVGLVPTKTTWCWESKRFLEGEYSSLAWNRLKGLGRYQDVHFQGIEKAGYTRYDSADILLPKSMGVDETFQSSSSYIKYDASDTEVATGTLERDLTLSAVEDVTIRAGTFTDCLKFSETVFWEEGQESYGSLERTFWLAPAVGLVKWSETVSESTPGEGERTEESSWELLLGYVNGEVVSPNTPPEADLASLGHEVAR